MNIKTIAVVAFAVLSLTLVASATVLQSTDVSAASESPSDYKDAMIWILGNADGDEDIDANDISVINKMKGQSASTYKLCDANNDGKIDDSDARFVQDMIDGKSEFIYYIDYYENVCKFLVNGADETTYIMASNRCSARTAVLLCKNNKLSDYKLVGLDQSSFDETEFGVKNGYINGTPIKVIGNGYSPEGELVSSLEKTYGKVVLLCSSYEYTNSKISELYENDDNVQIAFLPSWEDHSVNGVLTTGYLLGGVHKTSAWTQTTEYYAMVQKYVGTIDKETAKMSESDKHTVMCVYSSVDNGSGDRTRGVGSGDMENTEQAGGKNLARLFGTENQTINYTLEDLAKYVKDVDVLIVLAGKAFDNGPSWMDKYAKDFADYINGYVSPKTNIYATTWQLNGAPFMVTMAFYAKVINPDNPTYKSWSVENIWKEYCDLCGYGDRSDMSIDSISINSDVHHTTISTDSAKTSDDSGIYLIIAAIVVAVALIVAIAWFYKTKHA